MSKHVKYLGTSATGPQLDRYQVKRGDVVVTFEVDKSGRITIYDGKFSHQRKEFRFIGSHPDRLALIAKALQDVAKVVRRPLENHGKDPIS